MSNSTTPAKLDAVDKKILEILQERGRIANAHLATLVGLSPPAVLERVRKLEERGIIEKYVAILNEKNLGKEIVAFVSVSLTFHRHESIENFRNSIAACPEVLECYHIAGDEDYVLKVVVNNISIYENFLLEKLTKIPGVSRVRTHIVLSALKRETQISLD
jgi:Lrp/AsnC family leucine-responsive transcriptional regulator